MPVKDSHTRIKPLALASGHGRYITVTTERTLVSVGEWPLHITRGRSGRKKSGQGTLPDGGAVLGCRKVDFWFPLPIVKLTLPEGNREPQNKMLAPHCCTASPFNPLHLLSTHTMPVL